MPAVLFWIKYCKDKEKKIIKKKKEEKKQKLLVLWASPSDIGTYCMCVVIL